MSKKNLILAVFLLAVALISFSSAEYSRSGTQYISPGAIGSSSGTVPTDNAACQAGQDFIVQTDPLGCTPIVRSDLLEEQNVPVFCQLAATQINPLISVDAIKSIDFRLENGSQYISGINYHPAKSALGINTEKTGYPILENIGYAVILLKQQKNSSTMPSSIQGTLSANIKYDIENAFGIGTTTFYIPSFDEAEWQKNKVKYSFWSGRYFVRADGIDENGAQISIYDDTKRLTGASLTKGQSSERISLPGLDCRAGLQISLDKLVVPDTRARIGVNGENYEVADEEKFLDNKCTVKDLQRYGSYESARISCDTDDKRSEEFSLIISPKINLSIDNDEKEYQIGEKLFTITDGDKTRYAYLGYVGSIDDSKDKEKLFAVIFESPESKDRLSDADLVKIAKSADSYKPNRNSDGIGLFVDKNGKSFFGGLTGNLEYFITGKSYHDLSYLEEKEIGNKKVKLEGFSGPSDKELSQEIEDYYKKSFADYDKIIESYPNEKTLKEEQNAEVALYGKLTLSNELDQKRTLLQLCEEYKEKYPKSERDLGFCGEYELANDQIRSQHIFINGKLKKVFLDNIYEPTFDDYGVTALINGESKDFRKDDILYLGGGTTTTTSQQGFINAVNSAFSSQCSKYAGTVFDAANKYSIEPALLMSIMNIESSCDPNKGSTAGAVGLMQIVSWNVDLGGGVTCKKELGLDSINDLVGESNVAKNIECGALILKKKYESVKSEGVHFQCSAYTFTKAQGYVGKTEPAIDKTYYSWDAALRLYNGDYCAKMLDSGREVLSDHLYVDKVNTQLTKLRSAVGTLPSSGAKYIQLTGIGDNYAEFKTGSFGSTKVTKGTVENIDGITISIESINLKKLVKVTLNPKIDNALSKVSIPFTIPIEKRTIKLSPEQTKSQIDHMNKLISNWESATNKLGNVVTTMKAACLATGTVLTAKNFLNSLTGKAIARSAVMRSEGGWYEKCTDLVNNKQYKDVDFCLADKASEIEKDVNAYKDAIDLQNTQIKAIQESNNCQKDGLLGSRNINDACFLSAYLTQSKDELKKNLNEKFPNGIDYQGEKINVDNFVDSLDEKTITIEQLRELQLNSRLNEGSLTDMADKSLKTSILDVNKNAKFLKDVETSQDTYGVKLDYIKSKNTKTIKYNDEQTIQNIKGVNIIPANIAADANVRIVEDVDSTIKYLVVLDENDKVDRTYEIGDSGHLTLTAEKNPLSVEFEKIDRRVYNNLYKNPEVRYFETEPYKGMPAIVPFDKVNGWYAQIKQTLPVLGNIRAYDESGRVNSLYICNVGDNGLQESIDNDLCELVNLGTGQPYNQFPGLTEDESKQLVNKAVNAISEAKIFSGQTEVRIAGERYKVGEPMFDIPDIKCQDVMSPTDCKILFNVCDPVICPSSRCDWGGNYPVKDVIQSGISGSLLLCSQNFVGFGGDVYIPVCLSGVYAGMDGWLQIQKSYRDCLQDSLTTGQYTGICDEIYSLHACEFFWREGIPLGKYLISKGVQTVAGQNVKGGGEYLGVKSAYDNADKSFKFFTQYYAENSYLAFKQRSAEQVGTEVCKNFGSVVFPNIDSVVDSLTEPDSPAQFHGRFDEIPFTTTTNPPISQYKVWYFIYAGNDRGAYYQVYLKGDSSSSYYQDSSYNRIVGQGYINAGERVDMAPDFTAQAGYNQLCIRVNEQEVCGFKQVSTELAVNYIKDKYIQEQASQTNISGTSNCISGTPSAYSLLTPSIEGAASEIASPAVYDHGIIRICASENPGKGSDPYFGTEKQKWKEVGKCDESSIKCWLDTESVKEVIDHAGIEQETLDASTEKQIDILKSEGNYLSDSEVTNIIDNLTKEDDPTKIIDTVNKNIDKVFLTNEKGILTMFRGDAYADLAKGKKATEDSKISIPSSVDDNLQVDDTTTTDDTPSTEDDTSTSIIEEITDLPDDELKNIADELRTEGIDTSGLPKEDVLQKYEEIIPKLTGGFIEFKLEEGGLSNPTTYYSFTDGKWYFAITNGGLGKSGWKSYSGDYKFKEANKDKLIGYEKGSSFVIINLKDKTLSEGFNILMDTVEFDNGPDVDACILGVRCAKLSSDIVSYSKNIFEFKVQVGENDLYIKYDQPSLSRYDISWFWSNNGEDYYPFEDESDKNGLRGRFNQADWIYFDDFISNTNLKKLFSPLDLNEGAYVIFNFERKLNYDYVPNRPKETPTDPEITTSPSQYEDLTPEEKIKLISRGAVPIRENKTVILGYYDTVEQAAKKKIIHSECMDFADEAFEVAKDNGIPDPLLLIALMEIESDCVQKATSENKTFKKADGTKYKMTFEKGASYGLMEISGRTWCGNKITGLPKDKVECKKILLEDPKRNMDAGAKILKKYYDDYKKGVRYSECERNVKYYEWDAALRAYNGFGCYKGAGYYVEDVMKVYKKMNDVSQGIKVK